MIATLAASKVELNVTSANQVNTQMNLNRLHVSFAKEEHFRTFLDLQAVHYVMLGNTVQSLRPTVFGVPQGHTLGPPEQQNVNFARGVLTLT